MLGLVSYAAFYCWRQRRRGAAEATAAAQKLEDDRLELEGYKAAGINPDGFSEQQPEYDARTGMGMVTRNVAVDEYGMPNNEKFGLEASVGGGAAAAAATRPLLRSAPSGSPPGTPHGEGMHDPYSDSFSPIDNNGFGHLDHHQQSPPGMPPSGPLPGVPNRSFSSPRPAVGYGYGGEQQPQRSFTNPNGGQGQGQGGGYWRQDSGF